MSFERRRLRLGERIAAIGAVLLFVDLFIDWYGLRVQSLRPTSDLPTKSAFSALHILSPLLLVLVLTALMLAALTAAQRSVSLPIAASVILTAFGGVMTILVLYRVLVNEPGRDEFTTLRVGAWLGPILCAAITYGGYRSLREEGTGFEDAKAQAGRAVSSRGRTVPGPAASEPSRPGPSPGRH